VEENTSKVLVAHDANVASAALLNANAGTGTSLFVINLCASMAPLAVAKSLPGFETYRLYQVTRREDGRTRYRLRLGFFTSEADAEAVLNSVRNDYPTAFTTCLCDEDRKFTRGFVPEPSSVPKPVEAPKIAVVVDNTPAPKATPPKAATVAKPATDTLIAKAVPPKAQPKTDTVTVKALSSAPAAAPKTDTVTVKALGKAPEVKTDTVTVRALKESKPAPKTDAAVPPQALATGKFNATPAASKATPPTQPEALATGEFKAASSAAKPAAPSPQALATGKFAASAPAKTAEAKAPAPAPAADEIELSWDPPALAPAAGAATVAASKPTQDVIKAPPAAKAPAPTKSDIKPAAAKPIEPPKTTIEAPSKLLADIELSLESDLAPVAAKEPTSAKSDEPFRVGKGVEIPTTSLTLEASAPAPTPAKPAAAPAVASAPAKPAADASKMKAAQAAAPEAIKAAVTPTIRKLDGPLPDLDSTQTIRALTNDELSDDSQEKWFAIQLAVSEQPVNLDAMPRLDIFEAYRLYSVASAGSGKITHALRLGFFREDHSAEAVSGYLKTFFNSPTVVRISIAEQARFKDAPVAKPAAKGEAKVLDLSQARDRTPKVIPTVTMEVDTKKFDPLATGSFKAANATGTHKALATGSHAALNATGTHKALSTGAHKAMKPAAKSAATPTKRSQPLAKSMMTGKHKAYQPKKSLSEQLLDEAREVELSQSGIRKLPKNEGLFSKMFGKKK